jgi:DNA-binding GntR family transcriptional regulator
MLAARIDAARLARLRVYVDAMRTALDAQDDDAYARANVAFHDAIVASAGNDKLHDMYRRLVGELSLFRRAALVAHTDAMARSLSEHRAILTALASRDGDRAAALMHAHVNGGRQRAHEACDPAGQRSLGETLSASTDKERA